MSLYVVLFQASFAIPNSTSGTLYKFDCNVWDGYRNKLKSRHCYWADNLQLFTIVFSPNQHHAVGWAVKYLSFP